MSRPKKVTPPKSDPKEEYRKLGALLSENFALLTEGRDFVSNDVFVEKLADKEVGMTVGKVVKDSADKRFLLKKSGRIRADEDEGEDEVKSRDLDAKGLAKAIKASFNERCAAALFADIKQQEGYLPQITLVRSEFTFGEGKVHNKLKKGTGVAKVYVASEIIGDHSKVNEEDTHNVHLFDKRGSSHPDLIEDLTNDLGENAVIMFLLSNYDVKIDNFIHPEGVAGKSDRWMIPIDFGNAREEEPLSPDVIDGIDMIRNVSSDRSSKFASRDLRSRLASPHGGYTNTQAFYRRILTPEHFLRVIAKIEGNPDLEKRVWNDAYKWTFGAAEEKKEYANVVVARMRGLVNLKPLFLSKGRGVFSTRVVRNELMASEGFENLLIDQENPSRGTEFYRYFSELFDGLVQKEEAIISLLEEYEGSTEESVREGLKASIVGVVDGFNSFLRDQEVEMIEKLDALQDAYHDSDYLSGKNRLKKTEAGWSEERHGIEYSLTEVLQTLGSPLIERQSSFVFHDDSDEEELDVGNIVLEGVQVGNSSSSNSSSSSDSSDSSQSSSSHSSDSSNSSSSQSSNSQGSEDDSSSDEEGSKSEEQVVGTPPGSPWDLTKAAEYLERMEDILQYTQERRDTIDSDIRLLLTHLTQYDILHQVQREEFVLATTPSTSAHTTSNTTMPLVSSTTNIAVHE